MTERRLLNTAALAVGLASGVFIGRTGLVGLGMLRRMIYGLRQPFWRIPADLGLPVESTTFTAADGVELQGWFIPVESSASAPAITLVHGWPWNRCGNQAGSLPLPDATVDLLPLAQALHTAGYHVLMFDLRNHGLSDARPPVTFGLAEARDLVAAVAWLRARPEVDGDRLGLIGFSMGANTVLYGLREVQPVRAAVLVQPVRANTYAEKLVTTSLGPAGAAMLRMAEPIYRAFGGPPLDTIDPTGAAALSGETATLFLQGDGDPWGSVDEVRAMVEASPGSRPLLTVPSTDRFQGYQYVCERPGEVLAFLGETLA
jgi:pimeloyl-ACP methyl ester carboxylesterase